MMIYDFSTCDFDNEILSNKNTRVILSEKFEYQGNQESRVIVSNLKRGKRLVFLLNCKEVVEQTGYSDAEKESVINYLDSIKENLLEAIE